MALRWHGKESRWGERVKVNIPIQVSADAFAGAVPKRAQWSLFEAVKPRSAQRIAASQPAV
jgi:hypothetical protein